MEEIEAKKREVISRNQLHKEIMTCIYQYFFYLRFDPKPNIIEIIGDVFDQPVKEIDPYAKKVILETIKNAQEVVDNIQPHLIKYRFDRLSLIEQAILVMAYVEVIYLDQPKAIAINVAVKLAQKYTDAESFKFINAVLEKVFNG